MVLYFFDSFFIICQPQIIVSLLAIKTFLLLIINFVVGDRPAIPTIDEMVISNFILLVVKELKLLNILIFFL